jgi:hypothetical protein
MVVKRSPFSAGSDIIVNPKKGQSGGGKKTVAGTVSRGLLQDVAALSSPQAGDVTGAKRSSVGEERAQLETAARTLAGRLAGTGKYDQYMKDVQNLAAGKGKPSKGVWGWIKKSIIEPTLDPFEYAFTGGTTPEEAAANKGPTLGSVISKPQQFVESGLAYAAESIVNAPANLLTAIGVENDLEVIEPTSLGEVWRRANDPEWGVFKDPKYQTGIKWLDSGLQLFTDIATDPLTYTGVGSANYVGRAGREALALRFATPEMIAKYGDELAQAGVDFDKIVRYGEWALPKSVREAEGINSGLRFAGRTIKGTQGIGADIGVGLGKVRAGVGDVVYKVSPDLLGKIAPKSQQAGQMLGIGRSAAARGFDVSDEQVVKTLVGSTAQRHAKGATLTSYRTWADSIRDTIKTVKKMGWDDFYDLVEDPIRRNAANLTDEQRGLLDNYIKWQASVRDDVNKIYNKFGQQFGVDVQEVGFIEDYLHHKVSADGRNWLFGKAGQRAKGSLWKPEEMTLDDLAGNIGATRYRKVRAGGTFMGEPVQTGTIKELNEIAFKTTGVKNFFDTDIASIADSYAYSMAKTRGREAFARRLTDFGLDYIKPLIDKTVPNTQLKNGLNKTYGKMNAAVGSLRTKVLGQRMQHTDYAKRAIKLAQEIVDGSRKAANSARAEAVRVNKLLDDVNAELVQLYKQAGTIEASQRGAFEETYRALYNFRNRLQTAIANGREAEFVVVEELKKVYMQVYPNASKAPDNLEVLLSRIQNRKGIPTTYEGRHVRDRLGVIRKQLDEIPTGRELDETRQALIDEEIELTNQIDGFEKIGQARVEADYAPDGFIYGLEEDLVPFEPTPDSVPYKVMHAWREPNTVRMQDSVAVFAPPQESLLDLRNPEDFRSIFNGNTVYDVVAKAMDDALGEGADSQTFLRVVERFIQTGEIDEVFEQVVSPAQAALIRKMDMLGMIPAEKGFIPDDEIVAHFDELKDLLTGVASEVQIQDADVVGNQMFDDMLGGTLFFNDRNGVVVPAKVLNGDAPEDVYSLVLDTTFQKKLPRTGGAASYIDEAQYIRDNEMIARIMDGEYETASLAATTRRDEVVNDMMDADLNALTRDELEKEATSLRRKQGATKGAGTKRVQRAEELSDQWAKTQKVTVYVDEVDSAGNTVRKRRTMTRDDAQKLLASKDAEIAKLEKNLEREINKAVAGLRDAQGRTIKSNLQLQAKYQERLPMLFNQAGVLGGWNETVEGFYQAEIDNLNELLRERPPKNASGVQTRAWQQKVQRSIESLNVLPPVEAKAYGRLVKMIYADETKLAWSAFELEKMKNLGNAARMKQYMPNIIRDTEAGWSELSSLGMQIPDEVMEVWKPQLSKLLKSVEQGKFLKAYDWYLRFFKTWATASVGFSVRNAMSATFMNYVAGVDTTSMIDGVKFANALRKHGDQWAEKMGLSSADKALYEQAWKITEASGRGFGDELAEPVINSKVDKLINNRVTRAFGRANDFTERAVRMPMALDSLKRGMSYDEAFNRIARYHFDYSDLSVLDEKMKRFVPFWVWTSRNIPLQITSQLTRPGAYLTYQKIHEQLPPDADLMMPNFISQRKPLGLGGGNVLVPDLPFGKLGEDVSRITTPEGLLAQALPIPKVFIEGMMDRQAASGIPFTVDSEEARGMDKAIAWLGDALGADFLGERIDGKLVVNPKVQYQMTNIVPLLGKLQRLSGGAIGGKSSYKNRVRDTWLNEFGIPVRNVKSYERSEAIKRQYDIADFAKELEKQGIISKESRK